MERVVWHILYLQLFPVIIFNKHIVAHAQEGGCRLSILLDGVCSCHHFGCHLTTYHRLRK
jgi:hypothetical protein